MASKAQEVQPEDIEELLDAVDKTLDRLKTLYEQYFLGIQKQPPTFIHNDVERKLRDLTQLQIRNTGLRYRLATLHQKFGSYNAYWRRTLRQIENGTYVRNLSKIGRDAARTGAEIPEEILAAMPKRMREQVVRDREQALAIAKRRKQDADAELLEHGETEDIDVDFDGAGEPPEPTDDVVAMIKEPTELRRNLKTRDGAHVLDEGDADMDLNAFFAEVEAEDSTIGADEHPTGRREVPIVRGSPAPSTVARPVAPVAASRSEIAKPAPVAASRSDAKPAPAVASGSEVAKPAPVSSEPIARPRTDPALREEQAQRPSVPAPARPSVPLPARPVVPLPNRPSVPLPARPASQTTRPNPVAPGAAAAKGAMPVESMAGPFPRDTSGIPAIPKPGEQRPSGGIPAIPKPGEQRPSAGIPAIPKPGEQRATGGMPAIPKPGGQTPAAGVPVLPRQTPASGVPATPRQTPAQGVAAVRPATDPAARTGVIPRPATDPAARTGVIPRPATDPAARTGAIPRPATDPALRTGIAHTVRRATPAGGVPVAAPSSGVPVADADAGTSSRPIVTSTRPTARPPTPRPPTSGPVRPAPVAARPTGAAAKPPSPAREAPPPGMTDADVNALYAKYVKAKEMVGEKIGPGEQNKLLRTINAQAPKIMQQYNAKAVDFSVVVKDNQVIIRAKPKT